MTSPTPQPPLLECEGLSKVFCASFDRGRRYAIRDIVRLGSRGVDQLRSDEWLVVRRFSVTLRAGENVVVLGGTGSGKTTIARMLAGMLRADAGRVRLRGRVGLIATGRLAMSPFLTVWEFVQIGTSIHGAEPGDVDACCEEVLDIAGLSEERDTKLVELGKHRARHLALVSALVVPQDLRIFDGVPRGGDDPVARRVAARARQILERGSNLILSSTTTGLPSNVSHAMILHDGETLYEGDAETVGPIYDHFVYRVRRIQELEERRQEQGTEVGAAAVRTWSAAEVIRRAARAFERSNVASLVEDRVAQAWCGDQPVIVGPFLSDVGFELLYWRPFVAWMRDRFGARSAPVVAVSRGRVGGWYSGLASEYIDVCDLVPFDTFQSRNRERARDTGSWKQKVVSDFDQELLDRVAQQLGVPEHRVLHPSLIFRVCSQIWNGAVPDTWLAEHARYERFATPPAGASDDGDTEPYVAASFWFSSCFTDTRPHRHLMHQALTELSRRLPVVVVDRGDFPEVPPSLDSGDRIRVSTRPEHSDDQLREHARVIAGARAFIGTFGGISLTAPFNNVPTLMVFGEDVGSFAHHAAVTRRIAEAMPDVRVDTTRTTELTPARLGAWIDHALS